MGFFPRYGMRHQGEPFKQLQLYITQEQHDMLCVYAQARQITVSHAVRDILQTLLPFHNEIRRCVMDGQHSAKTKDEAKQLRATEAIIKSLK